VCQRINLILCGLPLTGVEGAGTVEEVGPGVTEVNVGDRVSYAGKTSHYCSSTDLVIFLLKVLIIGAHF
jgi:threonine dehydrogenase-like Zn-dependent dehydrogenase